MEFQKVDRPRRSARPGRAEKGRKRAASLRPDLEGLESRQLLAAKVTEFPIATANTQPIRITSGPDGNLWFTQNSFANGGVSRITTSGAITSFPTAVGSQPAGITTGPDGNLWFTESSFPNPKIGRITTAGAITEFNTQALPGGGTATVTNSTFVDITSGNDGKLYFADNANSRIGSIVAVANGGLPVGAITFVNTPTAASAPTAIATTNDGNIWFTEHDANKIGRLNPTTGTITEFAIPTANAQPQDIASAGNVLYFTEAGTNKIARIDATGNITEFAIPTANSQPRGITVAADGSVYFTEFNAGKIGRFDPATSTFVEFALPTGTGAPFGITTDQSGNIWFTELNANRIGTLKVPAPLQAQPVAILGTAGQPLTNVPVATFSDPSGNDPVGNYTATIDWGDGTTSAGTVSLNGGSFVVTGTHTYANPGNYTATTSIANTVDGRTVSTKSPATILSGPVNPTPGSVTATAGTPVIDASLATFTGTDPVTAYSVTVNWGDGSALGGGRVIGTGPGAFTILGSHVFSAPGTYTGSVTVRNGSGSETTFNITSTVTSLAPGATGLVGTAGTPITSGSLATLTPNPTSPVPDGRFYNATIDWGDGSPSTTATVSVVGGAILLTSGGHTYAAPGDYTVTYTLGDAGAPSLVTATTTATIGGLVGTGSPVTVQEGTALGSVVLATATASAGSPDPLAGYYTATIDWGDGSAASPGFIANAAGGGLTISGVGHVYRTPGDYTIRILVGTTGFPNLTVITTTATVTPNPAFLLSGKLNPASDTGVSNTDGITKDNTPNFFGTASPGAIVRLFAQSAGQPAPVLIAQTVADAGGAWSVTTPLIADGSYVVTADTINQAGVVINSATIRSATAPLVIDTVGPIINGFSITSAKNGQFQVIYQDDRSGLDGVSLIDGSNYSVTRTYPKTNPHRYFLVSNLLATGVAPGTNPATVTGQVFDGISKFQLKNGLFVFTIKDIQDLAGNLLDGDYYGTFPTGNQVNGGAFVARVAVKGLKPGPILPVSTTANPVNAPVPLANLVPARTAKAIAAANKAVAKQAAPKQAASHAAKATAKAHAKPHGKSTGSNLFQKVARYSVVGLVSKLFK